MTRWSSQTRRRLVLLVLGTAAVVGIIWFLVIVNLQNQLKNKADKIHSVQKQLQVTRSSIVLAGKYNEELVRNGMILTNFEAQMAQGDLYRWMIKALRPLQNQFDVNIIEVTTPQITELNIPPKVPYKSANYTISGMARFHEFGAFLAELENSSPFIRVKSVTLEATSSGVANQALSDKLSFKVECSTLIKQKPAGP
jgi:Tfp pilus assembly protein PilO